MKGLRGGDPTPGYRGDMLDGDAGSDAVYGHDYINTGDGAEKVAARASATDELSA